MWKVEKIVSKGDYNYAIVPKHPNATKNGYVLEHRIVVENHLGRLLDSNEVVHHVNGDKKDNRIDNLEVLDNYLHSKLHGLEKGRKWVKCKCPQCGNMFERQHNKTHLAKNGMYTCCSKICSGKLSRTIQLNGITHEVDRAISENIVREYIKYTHDNPEQTI